MTEKSHYCQHIALDVLWSRYNPKWGWTYQDEDYSGEGLFCCTIVHPCPRAASPW